MPNFSIASGLMDQVKDVIEPAVGVVSWIYFSTKKHNTGVAGYPFSKQGITDALLQTWVPKSIVAAIFPVEAATAQAKGNINIAGIFNKGFLYGIGGLIAMDFVGSYLPSFIRQIAKPALRGLVVGSAIGGLFDDPPDGHVIPMQQGNNGAWAMNSDIYTGRISQ